MTIVVAVVDAINNKPALSKKHLIYFDMNKPLAAIKLLFLSKYVVDGFWLNANRFFFSIV